MSHKKGVSLFSIFALVGLIIGSVLFGAAPTYAADGSGTNAVSPTSVNVFSTGNTFTFTSTAAETMNSGGISISVPAGWSAPQENIGTAGYITATSPSGIVGDVITTADSATGWQEDDTDACSTFSATAGTVKEGAASIQCINTAANGPDDGDSFSYRFADADWSGYTKLGVWLRSSVAISGATNYIQVAYIDGTAGTDLGGSEAEAFNVQSLAANTWTYFTFDLTAARSSINGVGVICVGTGCDSRTIFIDYVLLGPGSPTISGAGPWTVNVPYVTMPSAGTATITYGSGGGTSGVTAPSTSGIYAFTTQSRFDAGGALTSIASSPTVTVNKLSTTIAVSSSASTSVYGSTVTFTATTTPESGGLATGIVTFKNGDTIMGTGTLSGNVATFATSTLDVTGSPYSITAVYGGDGSFSGSTSTAIIQTITPKALTVTGMAAFNKIYDATTTAALSGGTLVGVVGSDVVSINTRTGSFADKNVGTGKTVTVTSVTLAGADAGNYTVTNPTGITATIAAVALTVTDMTASNKEYDATTTATLSGGSLVGVIGGDTVSINTRTGTFNNKNVGTSKPITVTSVTLTGTDAGNYTVTNPTDVVANITAKALAVTATASNKAYDGTATAVATLSDDRILGDVLTATSTSATFADKHVGTAKTVTVSGISITGTDSTNYSANATTDTTANITARAITVTAATNTKEYDQTTAASATPTITVGAIQVGDVAAFTETYDNKNVGTNKTVTPAGSVTDGNSGLNYAVTFVNNTTGIITAKGLTVTGMTGVNKEYDQTTTASVTGGSLDGVIVGDTVSLNNASTTASFANKNVGTVKTITVSGVALSGTDASNYTVANPTGITATITAKALAVTGLSALDKIYNATTTATLIGGSLEGVILGDTVSISTRVGAFADKHVGANKPVTVTAITLTGTDFENYSVTLPIGITATITAKGTTVSGITANDKDYDGNTSAILVVIGATLNGTIGGDDATLNTASGIGTFDTSEVGIDKLVTITGLTIVGADGGNYLLTQPTTTAAIKNPVPVVGAVSPNEAFTNDGDTIITVSGADFMAGTIIKFDGDNLTTTFINSTTATATISSSYLTTTGTSTITAFNPVPGGGLSTTSAQFLRKNRAPSISFLTPNTVEEGSGITPLTINGTNFISGTTVTFDGIPLTLTATSTTVLETNIPAALLATFGTSTVAVTNPTPGGGTVTSSFIITRGAVKFVFSGAPYSGTVDAPIVVTIQAQRENGTVVTNYQNDVTVNASGSASPSSVLVNIVNGVGTTSISNTVAEDVTLSLSDTQSTGLDVSATTAATFAHGAITQLTLAGPAVLNVGDRAAFTATRKDQFNNVVTTGPDTITYFYTTSTSTSAIFYDAPTAGNAVLFATMASGTSTVTVWYYDEDPGVYTITASDNGTTPDGVTGVDDATSALTVNAVPTRFVIINPTDGTVDAPITVTVQVQDNLSRLITDYQNDVTLVVSSTSGQATTTNNGLVNIVNGEGTITVSDTVAETAELSLTDSQGTGLNVASSTQDVAFAAGVVTQFSLIHNGNMEQNTRKEFVAGRKDQFGNFVSTSTTLAYLYASPTSTTKFYDADAGGNEITTVSLTPGSATTSFWFYSNTPATTTITVSDNATTPDSDTGIDDASNEILVTPTAVRFEIINPTDGTVDAPITVTVRALDEFGQVVPSFSEDVTIAVTGSAVANPVLVDIESGVGTTQVSDTVAEAVTLTLIDTQATGLGATSTQDVIFGVGAFAKLNLNNVVNATAGDLVAYTVTRTDQYDNQITSGSITVNLSATPTSTPGVFYNANSTAGPVITSIAIDAGNASAQFWYYNETIGSYQVTAQTGAVIGYDDIVIDAAAIAKFTINDRTSMNPGSRVQYTVARADQFNNEVTTGDVTAYVYADPVGAATAFYDVAVAGNVVTSITITGGQSTQNVWYYEEADGTHTITASDNATTADGSAGIIDASDIISVQMATGTRFVFNPDPDPLTITAGSDSLVTIQVQDDFGNIDTNYQNDVTLVTGVTSVSGAGLTNGQVLIDIVNGEGAITLTNTIAETVDMALSDSQGTGLNVSDTASLVWTPGAVTQFTITDQTSIVAGTSTPYTITRKDQYGNIVTSGSNLVYLYSNSTGANARFQATETGTSSISFVTLANGFASTTFWYYDEEAGTWDLTASDNATASDGATGIADASDSLIVTPAPVVADRYIVLDPADAGLNENIVVIIQAQDADGGLDTTVQEDVYLVFSTSSIQTTGLADRRVLVSVVDGIGTVTVTNSVAETVQLSLERLTGSTSTLAITSTQDVMFFVRQTTVAGGGGGGTYVAPTVTFSGRAYPGATVSLFARIDGQDIPLERDIAVRADGTFTIDFSGALRGLESFGLAIRDKDGKIAQVKTYTMNKVTRATEEKDLYIAPTAGLIQRTVTIGNNVGIAGSAAPGSVIRAEVDGQSVTAQTQAGNDGAYRLLVNTNGLTYGGHVIRIKQVDRNGVESDWSPSTVFMVSRALVTQADLNNNGGIDIGDWSIFLTRFASTDAEARKQVDLNNDGRVDISDFSVFIRSVVNR